MRNWRQRYLNSEKLSKISKNKKKQCLRCCLSALALDCITLSTLKYFVLSSCLKSTHIYLPMQILLRMEQEQKVTEDARIAAERDAAEQKYAAHLIQVNLGAAF